MDGRAVDPRGGEVLRIASFDLDRPGAAWTGNADFGMVFETDETGVGHYRLNVTGGLRERKLAGTRAKVFGSREPSAIHAIPLKPNRSYVVSALLNVDFPRWAEVNLGTWTMDAGGKQMMLNVRGIPNKTEGWQRWEWEFTADQRATHGTFALHFYQFPPEATFRITDLAFVELPPKVLTPYAKGEGVTFRGGPGNLPMQVEAPWEDGARLLVRTTGALYTFDRADNTISVRQVLERDRDLAVWRGSPPLAGLEVLAASGTECVLANDAVTLGIQCDSMMVVAPHEEAVFTLESKIAGVWNRLASGHLYAVDDDGGFSVNPDIPLGSGRLPRVNANVVPGRVVPGQLDFSGLQDDQTHLSWADAGWKIKWYVSPGERLAFSPCCPRPFPWKESFRSNFSLTHMSASPERYAEFREWVDILVLWDFLERGWGQSFSTEFTVRDEALFRRHLQAAKEAGICPIVYISPYFYCTRDPAVFAAQAERLRNDYGIGGGYYDGIPSQEWLASYEIMRMTREVFKDGIIILHNTGHASNGGPPLGEPSLKIPAVETYADITYGGELVYGYGRDWPYMKYAMGQYRKSNAISTLVQSKWEGLTKIEQDLVLLWHNSRTHPPQPPWRKGTEAAEFEEWKARYGRVLRALEQLWQEKGDARDFYKRYYLPKLRELAPEFEPHIAKPRAPQTAPSESV